jgi:hypothetical protein
MQIELVQPWCAFAGQTVPVSAAVEFSTLQPALNLFVRAVDKPIVWARSQGGAGAIPSSTDSHANLGPIFPQLTRVLMPTEQSCVHRAWADMTTV